MQKKYFFKVIFIFLQKKGDFRAFFLLGQRSVAEPGPTPSPWSIIYEKLYFVFLTHPNAMAIHIFIFIFPLATPLVFLKTAN